jgi:hypothetical protein
MILVLKDTNSIHALQLYFFNTHFNIILISKHTSPKEPILLRCVSTVYENWLTGAQRVLPPLPVVNILINNAIPG